MKNRDEPAFPRKTDLSLHAAESIGFSKDEVESLISDNAGLTKREYFAVKAMQAIMSASTKDDLESDKFVEELAEASCIYADALLKELEK